ncbi:MAG: YggT family protein [Dehalococcoidia bacterium]|nr:YggT family protein [Dehalococcoidia bacterium]
MEFLRIFVQILFQVLTFAILARVLLSWFVNPYTNPNPVFNFLIEITEPILAPLRAIIPRLGMFDLSPIVAMIMLQVMARIILDQLS